MWLLAPNPLNKIWIPIITTVSFDLFYNLNDMKIANRICHVVVTLIIPSVAFCNLNSNVVALEIVSPESHPKCRFLCFLL